MAPMGAYGIMQQDAPTYTIEQVAQLLGNNKVWGKENEHYDKLHRWYTKGPTTLIPTAIQYQTGAPTSQSTYGSSLVKSIINKELTLLFGKFPKVQLDINHNKELQEKAQKFLDYNNTALFLKLEQAIKDHLVYGLGGVWLTPEYCYGMDILMPEPIIPTEICYDTAATTIAD